MAGGTSAHDMLIKNGFIKPQHLSLYEQDARTKKFSIKKDLEKVSKSDDHADIEIDEEVNVGANSFRLQSTNYPQPYNKYRLIFESFNLSMEETYYWMLSHLRQDWGFHDVEKIVDIYSASENSAFFGQSAHRLSIQEDRASNFLRVIGQLVKELFQIVRELRIIDERLEPYYAWERTVDGKKVRSKSADVTLKGVFADFAENKGGQMQPGSLYHLSQTVGYSTLPDLFFNTHVYKQEDVDKVVDSMHAYNANVRNVLKRKLFQFVIWKEKTENELIHRRTFLIRYLRQHWATIKMYMAWTKPYLRHIKRLQMSEKQLASADLVSSFESSATEVELLFHKPGAGKYNACVLVNFMFNTRPVLQYRQEQFQGPVHVGRVTVNMRTYGWTDEDIANYKRLKEDEDKELLRLVDDSVAAAMEDLGDDLEKYINMEGKDVFENDIHEKFGKKDDEKKKPGKAVSGPSGSAFEPVTALFWGFKELFTPFIPSRPKKGSAGKSFNPSDKAEAGSLAEGYAWGTLKNYKKSHGLLSW